MKKRIGNDIHFVWTVKRKNGDILTPETFEGKDVQLKLISPMKQEAVIEDVVFSTGQVSWTFRGKHQTVLGTYIAILCENRGENNMVTIDEVEAVTLVRHTYQETENEDGNITSDSAEFETTINDSSSTPIDAYTKTETDAMLAGKVDVLQIQGGYTASRYMSGTSFSDNSDQQGRVRSAAYEVGGITLVDLNGNIAHLQVNGVLQLNGKAIATEDDTALLVDGGDYNSQSKEIELKHGNTVLARIDARAFVKDGMVDSVVIENGYIVITFNTDAGKEAISLALTDIFNPANYYDKTAADNLLANKVDKVSGKGLSTNDYTDTDKNKLGDLPTNAELTTALAGKQDTISDLTAIRSGAAAGATAVQPAELVPINTTLGEVENALTEEVAETVDVEDDASGQTGGTWIRPQSTPHISFTRDMQANTITSQTIDGVSYSSGVSFGVYNQYDILHIASGGSVVFYVIGNSTYYRSPNIRVAVKYQGEESFTTVKTVNLPTTSYGIKFSIEVTGECDIALYYYGSGSAQPTYTMGLLARIDYNVSALIDVSEVKDDVHANSNAIAAIEQKIPAQASASNQLADKGFVNSSVATATATYMGSYNLVSDLSLTVSATQQQIADALATKMAALSITPDNNDYCFVQIPTADATPTEIARIDRYKYDGTAWAYEYTLNNSGFTAAQWAALNSGITSGLVIKLSDLPTATELATLLAGKASTQELAGKEDITPIEAVASGTTAITAQVNKYYEVAGTVSSLTVTLPTPTANTEVTMVVVHLTVGASPTVIVTSVNEVVKFSAAYSVVANKEYELSCLYNGSKWIVSSMEVAV